jgi:hypothetical protein
MRAICLTLSCLLMLLFASRTALSSDAKVNATDPSVESVSTPTLSLGGIATIKINGLKEALSSQAPSTPHKLSDFVLYLDGHPVAYGADRGLTDVAASELGFFLTRTEATKSAWIALLGGPTSLHRSVQVNVGYGGSSSVFATTGASAVADLTLVRPWGLVFGVVFLVLLVAALVMIGRASDLLRDNQPTDFGGAKDAAKLRRPFSLAQSQMAWWFSLVIGAYIFLFLITGDVNTLTAQALVLRARRPTLSSNNSRTSLLGSNNSPTPDRALRC